MVAKSRVDGDQLGAVIFIKHSGGAGPQEVRNIGIGRRSALGEAQNKCSPGDTRHACLSRDIHGTAVREVNGTRLRMWAKGRAHARVN